MRSFYGDLFSSGRFVFSLGMIIGNNHIILGDVTDDRVVWTDVDSGLIVTDIDAVLADKLNPVELAVTGKAFEKLSETGLMKTYLLDIRVFGRMTPNCKSVCIGYHMQHGITAMCGDGG